MIFFLFDFLWQCMRISASFMLFSIVFLTLVTRLDVFISIFPETSPICSMLCPTKSSSFLSLVSVSLQYCLEVKTQFAHLLIWYISCSLHFHSKLWIHVHFSQYFSSSHLFFFFALSVVADFPFRVVRGVTVSVLIAELDTPSWFSSDNGVSCMGSQLPSTARNGQPLLVVGRSSSVAGQPFHCYFVTTSFSDTSEKNINKVYNK